jgi:hypothetical protein
MFATNRGLLVMNYAQVDGTFSATIASVPVPGTLALGLVAHLAVDGIQRKRLISVYWRVVGAPRPVQTNKTGTSFRGTFLRQVSGNLCRTI